MTAPLGRTADQTKCAWIVAAGDTLFSIAQVWGISLQDVERGNPRAGHPAGNLANLHPGDQIVHPWGAGGV